MGNYIYNIILEESFLFSRLDYCINVNHVNEGSFRELQIINAVTSFLQESSYKLFFKCKYIT